MSVLPLMHHFMNQRRQSVLDRAHAKIARVHGDFIARRAASIHKPLAAEVTVGALFALEGDEARGQLAAEQLDVEVVVSGL